MPLVHSSILLATFVAALDQAEASTTTNLLTPSHRFYLTANDKTNAISEIAYNPITGNDGVTFLASASKHLMVYDVDKNIDDGALLDRFDFDHGTGFMNEDGNVSGIGWSPDGKILATTGLKDQTVRFRDAATREILQEIVIPEAKMIVSLEFSPDGKMLAVGVRLSATSIAAVVILTTPDDGMTWEKSSVLLENDHTGYANFVKWSPDGSLLASCGSGWKIWSTSTWETVQKLSPDGVYNVPKDVKWSPDGKLLAIATGETSQNSWGTEVYIFETEIWKQGVNLTASARRGFWNDPAKALLFSPDSMVLLSAHEPNENNGAYPEAHVYAYHVDTWEVALVQTLSYGMGDVITSSMKLRPGISHNELALASAETNIYSLYDAPYIQIFDVDFNAVYGQNNSASPSIAPSETTPIAGQATPANTDGDTETSIGVSRPKDPSQLMPPTAAAPVPAPGPGIEQTEEDESGSAIFSSVLYVATTLLASLLL
eukprot:CAMPEP_0183734444 /NCGR_PEP_ID=MMETSP0737-20130205/43824_1 /TAXON_ID=385413 /ORGANISM="Thalassiosira miniscula, Strain CCMP1093" /LENGTH=486 /DNA_ID=CAMNT_0025967931 /DNA_START=143 /DNA_END=1603 /DNA_ORIENTATION=-